MYMDLTGNLTLALPAIEAERCIAELQRGRAIALTPSENHSNQPNASYQLLQLVETLTTDELESLLQAHNCQLVLTRARAKALGLHVDDKAICIALTPDITGDTIRDWSGLNPLTHRVNAESTLGDLYGHHTPADNHAARAALNLATHAHALPAFVMYSTHELPLNTLSVSAEAAATYADQSGKLIKLSSARIPLATAESVELTVFRERHGNAEHVAITVGEPDLSDTVTVRLHSSCFTGDILGSMKCDCGEQLQGAIASMAQGNGGVVLYVSQEGRGIGLASKLLAYQLQGQGMDTIDANQHLGFEADERRYSAAVVMLEHLGINTINLMTNNPLKIAALRKHGVKVLARVPSPATVNEHNARYLETKRNRAGHLSSTESAV